VVLYPICAPFQCPKALAPEQQQVNFVGEEVANMIRSGFCSPTASESAADHHHLNLPEGVYTGIW
jgi:hypothetical protein